MTYYYLKGVPIVQAVPQKKKKNCVHNYPAERVSTFFCDYNFMKAIYYFVDSRTRVRELPLVHLSKCIRTSLFADPGPWFLSPISL